MNIEPCPTCGYVLELVLTVSELRLHRCNRCGTDTTTLDGRVTVHVPQLVTACRLFRNVLVDPLLLDAWHRAGIEIGTTIGRPDER